MSFDIVVTNLSVSVFFGQVVTEIPSPIEITKTVGVLIRIRGTFNEIVNHRFEVVTLVEQFRGE
tara:strand:+ start:113 stop:304 length:192 start_codon:yes stop_codon:yes gene_type:complete